MKNWLFIKSIKDQLLLLNSIICFIFFISTNSYSQSNDTTDYLSEIINEVVITAQITEVNKEDAIQNIKVIGSDILSSGLFENLSDVLKYSSIFNITQDNILGSSIVLQGVSGQGVKILIDDVPVIGRVNGNIDVSQISLSNVERIEIVEGPLSVYYGTDALAGTINIITKKDYPKGLRSNINTYYESVGRYNADISLSYNLKNQTLFSSIGRNYFSGWSKGDPFQLIPVSQLADTNRYKDWKPKEQFYSKLNHQIKGKKFQNRIYCEYFQEKITNRGFPRLPYFENAFDDYYYTYRVNFGTNLKYSFDEHDLESIISFNDYKRIKNTFYNDLTTLTQNLVNDPLQQDTSRFNMINIRSAYKSNSDNLLNYQIGLDYINQYAKGERILENQQSQSDIAMYSNIEFDFSPRVKFSSGIRVIHNTKYRAPIIPSLNFLYKLDDIQIRISYAKGFRAPTLKELFFEFIDINHNIIGNEELSAETSNNISSSIGYKRKFSNSLFSVDLSLFINHITNKIDLLESATVLGQYSYFNINNYKTRGVSLSPGLLNKNFKINLGSSIIGKYNSFDVENQIEDFIYSFDYHSNVIYNLRKDLSINLFYKLTGKRSNYYLNDVDEIIKLESSNYHLLDFSIKQSLFSDKLDLSLGSKNIFNVTNIRNLLNQGDIHSSSETLSPIAYGRTFFVGLNLKL